MLPGIARRQRRVKHMTHPAGRLVPLAIAPVVVVVRGLPRAPARLGMAVGVRSRSLALSLRLLQCLIRPATDEVLHGKLESADVKFPHVSFCLPVP